MARKLKKKNGKNKKLNPIKAINGETVDFADGLYRAVCQECDSELEWRLYPDPDSIAYDAECCDLHYTMVPVVMKFEVEPVDDDESFEVPDDEEKNSRYH